MRKSERRLASLVSEVEEKEVKAQGLKKSDLVTEKERNEEKNEE